MTDPARAGFSLIEAMTALIIASLVLLAAYGLQQQLVAAEVRYERVLALAERKRTALVLIRDINPTAEPTGVRPMAGGRRAVWSASPIGPFRPTVDGRDEARLYRVEVTLREQDGRIAAVVAFDRVGWRKVQRFGGGVPGSTARP